MRPVLRLEPSGRTHSVCRAFTALMLFLSAAAVCHGQEPAAVSPHPQEPSAVSFKSTDGVDLKGHLFGKGTTGVVLVHMFPADQKSWFPYARRLAGVGCLALTFDCRGYGESGGQKVIGEIDRDLEGAYQFIQSRVQKVFLMGASMGGTAAIQVAARKPTAGVVSLSGPVAFRGLDALDAIKKLKAPILLIAAEGDRSAAESARWFSQAAAGPETLLVVPGSEHGTNLLDGPNARKLDEAILQFLRR